MRIKYAKEESVTAKHANNIASPVYLSQVQS